MDNRESYRTRGTFVFHFQIGGRARSGELCFCFRCRAQKRTDTLPRVRIVARRAKCAEI